MSAPYTLPPLPYDESALAPAISARTLSFHHGKHHAAYIAKTNAALDDLPALADLPLDALVRALAKDKARPTLFNNAAQAWNHGFYWQSLTPRGGGAPPAVLSDRIKDAFGDVAACKAALKKAALDQFGAGWAWLVAQDGKLAVIRTPNAETPITTTAIPLLAIDVWEHAYYLDYQHQREAHVDAVLDTLLNWGFAADNLG